MKRPEEIVLAIPDTQCPFHHRDSWDFLEWARDKFNPTKIVNMGDEVDFHALSDYDHDPDGRSAGDELAEAVKSLKPLYQLFPKVMSCISNHTSRPYRQALKAGIPSNMIRSYSEILQAPKGWQWADQWEIDGVLYEHGTAYSGRAGALKAAMGNMQSTCIGHLHSHAGIQYYANAKHLIFGFNTGCLIDKNAYAFNYGKTLTVKPILGCGIIEKGVPKFVPMLLKPNGRWIGRAS